MRQHAPRSAPRCRMRRRFMPFTARWGRISPPANGRTMRRWGRSRRASRAWPWPDSLADGQQLSKDDDGRDHAEGDAAGQAFLYVPRPLAHQPGGPLLGSPARAASASHAICHALKEEQKARRQMAYRRVHAPLHPAAADAGADRRRHLVHENHPALSGLGAYQPDGHDGPGLWVCSPCS